MATEQPPATIKRQRYWFNALTIFLPAFVIGTLPLIYYMSIKGDRWIGPGESDAMDFDPALPMIFSATLLTTQLIERLRREAIPEPLLLAPVITVAIWLSSKLFFSLGLVFMYAGVLAMVGITSILTLSVLMICAWIARYLPKRQSGRLEAFAKIAMSLFILASLLPPWQTMRIKAMPGDERNAAALAYFGKPFTFAASLVRECGAIREVTGNLNVLAISHRRNLLESTPYWDSTYFDFDYEGSLGSGRLTLTVQHLKPIEPGNPDGHEPSAESIVGWDGTPEALVYIYPNYSKSWVNHRCALPVSSADNAKSSGIK